MKRHLSSGLALFVTLIPLLAMSHELDPALLDVTEQGKGVYAFVWKSPLQKSNPPPERVYPPGCQERTPHHRSRDSVSYVERWELLCPDGSLTGKPFGVKGGEESTRIILHVSLLDGRRLLYALSRSSPEVVISPQHEGGRLLNAYVGLGVEHISIGADHLLFVLGLLLLVPSRRSLFMTITSFTIAHSLTLSAATLGWIHVSSAPAEAAIALSIVLVAYELARAHPVGQQTQPPWAIAFPFGLLHGLGFAGALADTGLPSTEVGLALLGFNVGVELGQLLFVGVLLLAWEGSRRVGIKWTPRARVAVAYAMGAVSLHWFIDRTVAIWS